MMSQLHGDDSGSICASQPFSSSRESAYAGVLPRQVEVLIEGYLGAALRSHNCIWMSVSSPGTGYCGQLAAKILFEYVKWVRASYDDGLLPSAVVSGFAQPTLPRLEGPKRDAHFLAVVQKNPSLRPQRAVDVSGSARWNGYTIEQYASAHHLQEVVDKLSECEASFETFMKDNARRRQTNPLSSPPSPSSPSPSPR